MALRLPHSAPPAGEPSLLVMRKRGVHHTSGCSCPVGSLVIYTFLCVSLCCWVCRVSRCRACGSTGPGSNCQTGICLFVCSASVCIDNGMWRQALFERAVLLAPLHVRALYNFGLFQESVRHDYNKAELLFRSAVNIPCFDPAPALDTALYPTLCTLQPNALYASHQIMQIPILAGVLLMPCCQSGGPLPYTLGGTDTIGAIAHGRWP